MSLAIEARNLGKRYELGEKTLMNFWRSSPAAEFWALKDVSFEVREGEVVGVIGSNGAGKSTLLKLLSRVSAPSTGIARIRGRLGSILEVGTGFHPELTGRENIYLSGAILGMSKAEVQARFEEIVDFAEVEKFVDSPVKRYSSGMYVRLAFAVAAHLEPDILIVDEVLAVGDVGFQKKCLAKMDGNNRREGRTILIVSHNMQVIRGLCTRAIVLERGRLAADGSPNEVINRYLQGQKVDFDLRTAALGNRKNRAAGRARIGHFGIDASDGRANWSLSPGDRISFRADFEVLEPVASLAAMIFFTSPAGEMITTIKEVISPTPCEAGYAGQFSIHIPSLPFRPGDFQLSVALGNADFSIFEDILDTNVGLPAISVESAESDWFRRVGMFSLDYQFEHQPRDATQVSSNGVLACLRK